MYFKVDGRTPARRATRWSLVVETNLKRNERSQIENLAAFRML